MSRVCRKAKWLGVGALAVGLQLGLMHCSPNDSTPDIPPGTESTLQVRISSSGADTLVGAAVDTFTLQGTIEDVTNAGVAALYVNTVDYTTALATDKRSFSLPLELSADTTRVVVGVKDAKGGYDYDSLRIIREKVLIQPGMAQLSGTLYKAGGTTTLAKRMYAQNAAGALAEVSGVLPLSGADILAYNADSVSTASAASARTDASGAWQLELPQGNYFVFAVYFDQQNLELITAALQNVRAVQGQNTQTEEKVAMSDDIAPMVSSFLDAQVADENNTFLASDVPLGLPIVISFSEPMNRSSVGDSVSGIVLGTIDPTDQAMALKDTIAVKKLWNASSKQLHIVPRSALSVGSYYRLVIPTSVKDLALNKLAAVHNGIFKVIQPSALPPFAVSGTTLTQGDTVSLQKPIEIHFNRPIDEVAARKAITLSPAVEGVFFEAKGTIARIVYSLDKGLQSNTAYTLTVNRSLTDLMGDTLAQATTVSFRTKLVQATTDTLSLSERLASFVTRAMEFFIAGDLESFAQHFHPLLEVISLRKNESGQTESGVQNYSEFIAARKADAAMLKQAQVEGVLDHKKYVIDNKEFWHVIAKPGVGSIAQGADLYLQSMQNGGFDRPVVLDANRTDISEQVEFRADTLIRGTNVYVIGLPRELAFAQQKESSNPSYWGTLMEQKTNIEMQRTFITSKTRVKVRSVTPATVLDAPHEVLLEMVDEMSAGADDTKVSVMALNMSIINQEGAFLVRKLIAEDLFEGGVGAFDSARTTVLNDTNFNAQKFSSIEGTKQIDLLTPAAKQSGVSLPVGFSWKPVAGVGGYLFVISDELSGGSSGLLLYTRDTLISIDSSGQVSGARVLSLDTRQIKIPMPAFSNRLGSLDKKAVYGWKVIGVSDTSAATIGTQIQVVADSDFGNRRGWGIFTLAQSMPDLSNVFAGTPPPNQPTAPATDRFRDSDGDKFPDWMELALGTNAFNDAEWPDFRFDSDKDGIADFFEHSLGTNPEDAANTPADTNANHIPDAFEQRPQWDRILAVDSDRDGFPDEIEFMFGTDAWNDQSKPRADVKGSAPAGSFSGKFWMKGTDGSEMVYMIALTLFADSVGKNYATIDSTTLKVVPPRYSSAVRFESGEWVFHIPLTEGLNRGKFFKFRCKAVGYEEIEGPVDMVDGEGMGGPYVGRIRARTDGNLEQQTPVVQPGQVMQLGEDMVQRFENPSDSAEAMELTLALNAAGEFTVSRAGSKGPLSAEVAVWQPHTFPMFKIVFVDNGTRVRLEGMLGKDAQGRLYLQGPMMVNEVPSKDFILRGPQGASVENPSGVWGGFMVAMPKINNPQQDGPRPFIGSREAIDQALQRCINKGILDNAERTVTIVKTYSDGIWHAVDEAGTLYDILEDPQDISRVLVKSPSSSESFVVLRGAAPTGPVNPGPQPLGFKPFTGERSILESALNAAANKVSDVKTNSVVLVDGATLREERDSANGSVVWVVEDAERRGTFYLFMAQDSVSTTLARSPAGNPLVQQRAGGVPPVDPVTPKGPVFFRGAVEDVVSKLSTSRNTVVFRDSSGKAIEVVVDAQSVRTQPIPEDTLGAIVVVSASQNPEQTFAFIAQGTNPALLALDGSGALLVVPFGVKQSPKIFSGDSTRITTALVASANWVLLPTADGAGQKIEVNSASLQWMCNPQAPQECAWLIGNRADGFRLYGFVEDPQVPGTLQLKDGVPVVQTIELPPPANR